MPSGFDFARVQSAAQSSTTNPQGLQPAIQEGLVNPLMTYVKPVKKIGQGVIKMGKGAKDVHSAISKRKGDDKRYELDNGLVTESKRGENGTTANAFTKKIAAMNAEKGTRGLIGGAGKTLTGIADATSMPALGAAPPWALAVGGIGKIASGSEKLIGGTADAARRGHVQGRARKVEHELLAQGDAKAYAFQGAKHNAGAGRNDAILKAAKGAVGVTNGVVDLAAAGDPTVAFGATGAAAFGKASRGIKKGGKLLKLAKEQRLAKKIETNDRKARGGDQKAMQWMLGHDPKMASASMLMHAQDDNATDEERAEAAKRAGHALRLGDASQEEMKTGRLNQFDKIYSNRTGQKMDPSTSLKGRGAESLLGRGFQAWDATVGKVKAKRRDKKQAKYGMNDQNHLDAVEAEYKNVREFRAKKQVEELQDNLEQKHLAEQFAGQQGGTSGVASGRDVWDNPNGATLEELIAERHEEDALDGKPSNALGKKLSGMKKLGDGELADMAAVLSAKLAPQPPTLGPPPNRPPPAIPAAPPPVLGPAPNRAPPPIPGAPAPVLGPAPSRAPPPIPGFQQAAPTGGTSGPSLLGNQRAQPAAFQQAAPTPAARGTGFLGAQRNKPAPPAFEKATASPSAQRAQWLTLGSRGAST